MILSTLLNAIAVILHMLLSLYMWIVIIAALITFVQPDPYNKIVQTLYRLTEPLYIQIRKALPTVFGGIDVSPLIVIVIIKFIDLFFVRILEQYAHSL